MKNKNRWVRISDSIIRHVWVCTNKECADNGHKTMIDPSFYADNGTPLCECGEDMSYSHTEILLPK